jgi:6-phosphogluconate dehydrogenase
MSDSRSGVPSTVITEAVLARLLSGLYELRQIAAKEFPDPEQTPVRLSELQSCAIDSHQG